eukprot:jgi/Mesvir1/25932/Mv20926-RA.1
MTGNDSWQEFSEREQLLLEGLRRRYNAVLHNRRHYFLLLSFVAFMAMYMPLLVLQRRSFLGFDINRSFAHLAPKDEQGNVLREFDSPQEVYDWLNHTVTDLWAESKCGDGNCADGEAEGFGWFGCSLDCGWRKDLVHIAVQLDYKFQEVAEGSGKKDASFWNVCKKGACTAEALNGGGEDCYFQAKQPFEHYEGMVFAELFLPSKEEWVVCLQTPPPILSVAGRIVQFSMSEYRRGDLAHKRDGFNGRSLQAARALDGTGPRFYLPPDWPSKTPPENVTLVPWDFSERQSLCMRDCTRLAACAYRDPNTCLNESDPLEASAELRQHCLRSLNCSQDAQRSWIVGLDPGGYTGLGDAAVECHLATADFSAGSVEICPVNPLERYGQECAPDCPVYWVGDGICDLACAVSPECGLDFGDCCEYHNHLDGRQHYHCPSNENRLEQDMGLVIIEFTVPSSELPSTRHAAGDITRSLPRVHGPLPAPGKNNKVPLVADDSDKHKSVQGRWVGTRNKVVAGILIHQTRNEEPDDAHIDTGRFTYINASLSGASGRLSTKPFGRNPVVLQFSSLYLASAVDEAEALFNTTEMRSGGVPYGFFNVSGVRGYDDGFPVFLDANYTQREVLQQLAYIVDGGYIDHHTRKISFQLVAYNAELRRFGTLIAHIDFKPAGVIVTQPQIEIFSVEMYSSPGDKVRAAFEVLFAICVVIATFIELGSLLAIYRATGSVLPAFTSFYKLVALASLALMHAIIIIWCYFIVKYNNAFDARITKPVYEQGFRAAKAQVRDRAYLMKMSDGGAGMVDVMNLFSDVMAVIDLLDIYFFLNFLNLMLMMLRLLNLTAFHPMLGIVARTLSRAANDIAHFMVVAGIIFISFAISANLAFGYRLSDFSTLGESLNTCFLMLIGELGVMEKLRELVGLKLVIAWTFFWIYMITFYFILFQFFVAFVLAALREIMESRGPRSTTAFTEVSHLLFDETRTLLRWLSFRSSSPHDGAQHKAAGGDRQVARDVLRWLHAAQQVAAGGGGVAPVDDRPLGGTRGWDDGTGIHAANMGAPLVRGGDPERVYPPHGRLGGDSSLPPTLFQGSQTRGGQGDADAYSARRRCRDDRKQQRQHRVDPAAKVIVLGSGDGYTYAEVLEALERARIARKMMVSGARGGGCGGSGGGSLGESNSGILDGSMEGPACATDAEDSLNGPSNRGLYPTRSEPADLADGDEEGCTAALANCKLFAACCPSGSAPSGQSPHAVSRNAEACGHGPRDVSGYYPRRIDPGEEVPICETGRGGGGQDGACDGSNLAIGDDDHDTSRNGGGVGGHGSYRSNSWNPGEGRGNSGWTLGQGHGEGGYRSDLCDNDGSDNSNRGAVVGSDVAQLLQAEEGSVRREGNEHAVTRGGGAETSGERPATGTGTATRVGATKNHRKSKGGFRLWGPPWARAVDRRPLGPLTTLPHGAGAGRAGGGAGGRAGGRLGGGGHNGKAREVVTVEAAAIHAMSRFGQYAIMQEVEDGPSVARLQSSLCDAGSRSHGSATQSDRGVAQSDLSGMASVRRSGEMSRAHPVAEEDESR